VQVAEVTNGSKDTYALINSSAAGVDRMGRRRPRFHRAGTDASTVRTRLLISGEVGDGDGDPIDDHELEAGLLFVDVMRDEFSCRSWRPSAHARRGPSRRGGRPQA
jgi:hypothetical protein